ncbi:Probable adenine permease PurP [Anaerococcus prevotii]|uniref:Xanthine/uracil/vitamin C permease n=1 Tax=Anaerococcus prevotii (strain ATCC 9321 / DSM 20548 / JCM 6508 / NCTC 11806 / PC1) TaxID=525919 RepID=C7RG31_ANAPD|nr:NCS2 family permease [Anaerococcus prevotii]ACV28442.1 Xanthine/uracil/vitamin C permease [Anaerococcus prevotii DSM 20548]SUU94001.1 Probable adenine permease PurP [Anaerococcus prevotii]
MAENSFFEKAFKLKKHGTDTRTEIMAGITTFMTMSYILAVNPQILSESGMDYGAVFTGTIIASVVAMLFMAFYANLPFGMSAGMGLNAFFTYTVVMQMGKTWQFALTAVFLEGIIFLLLSFVGLREAIFNSIPINLKKAVSVGIGLFIAEIGLLNAGILKVGEISLSLGELTNANGFIFFFALIIMVVLTARNVKGALLWGILVSTILSLILGVTHFPDSHIVSLPPTIEPVFFKLDFSNVFSLEMFSVLFSFLFVDIFDTLGTLTGVATKADMLDENGNLPEIKKALLSDAIGTTLGSMVGTSTVTTFVESSSGVAEGGRTGLTALATAACFVIAAFFFPVFSIIPASATAAALVTVGLFMITTVVDIDFSDISEAFPAFMTILMMPLTYSIAEGISFGMISYALIKLLTGKGKEVSPLVYVLSIVFILRYLLPLF